jgi:GH15 family glucan-1,4-alpha-glucosidase
MTRRQTLPRRALLPALLTVAVALIGGQAQAGTPLSSWHELTTGNGFGFAVFDSRSAQVTQLLERPYRYLHPGPTEQALGPLRRNLAYDLYFGARVGSQGAWLRSLPQSQVGYVDQSGVIRSTTSLGGVTFESSFVAPFGLEANGLLAVVRARNSSNEPRSVDVFLNPNLRLGPAPDPDRPSGDGEQLAIGPGTVRETGPGGGVVVYLPLGAPTRFDSSGTGFGRVQAGQDLLDAPRAATGNDLTMVFQKSLGTLPPGGEAAWGVLIGFSPRGETAALESELVRFVAGRSAQALLGAVEAEWEAWRTPPPPGLTDDERRVYRQSEAILRMAQVREPYLESPKQKGRGMILASLPPGIWSIGWVRDQQYATVALARMGHTAEALLSLDFILDAEANRYMRYAGVPYQVSITRYFGDGQEESDWNQDGPNIEFDGWGLYLWAVRSTLDAAQSTAWLDGATRAKLRVYEALRSGVVEPLLFNLDPTGLVVAENSIWESHWDKRKQYTYTQLTSARGLCDFAHLAAAVGDGATAERARQASLALRAALHSRLVDPQGVLAGSLEELRSGSRYYDAAVVEGVNWQLLDGPVGNKTLETLLGALAVQTGGLMRNDDALSTYDSNEWLFIDLRAGSALRRTGGAAKADQLINWATAQARLNYDLVPELFNQFPADGPIGAYAGAIPMVGFGAGAYALHLLDRAQPATEPSCDAPLLPAGSTDGGAVDGGATTPQGGGCALAQQGTSGWLSVGPLLAALLLGGAIRTGRTRRSTTL